MNKNIGYLIIVLIVIAIFVSGISFVTNRNNISSNTISDSERFSSGAELITSQTENGVEQEFITPNGKVIQKRSYDTDGLIGAVFYDEDGNEISEEEWFTLGLWEYFITEG